MFQFIFRNTSTILFQYSKYSLNLLKIRNSNTCLNKSFFATKKKKRVIELNAQTIKIQNQQRQGLKGQQEESKRNYMQMRQKIKSLPWQQMRFDSLCALDEQTINALEIELKKDKFNISDEQFLSNELKSGKLIPLGTYENLNYHYKKVYSLLKNTNDFYLQFPNKNQPQKGYLNQIYITDLKNDLQLKEMIARFLKNINQPHRLQGIAEPTFVKHLLALKRQLMLLGIHFQTKAQKIQSIHKKQRLIQSNQKQQLPKINILQILNYQYQFWQDVKHNRAKNGSQDLFIIQTKQVQNPNSSILLRQIYPTVKIKYIARKKHFKETQRCFCLKAELLVQIDQKMKRKIKVEWKGPSNRNENQVKIQGKKKKQAEQQIEEEAIPRVGYSVIDYEDIYDGNATIKPIFYF